MTCARQNEGSVVLPLKQGRVSVDRLTGVLERATGRPEGGQRLLDMGAGVGGALGRQVPLLLENANGVARLHGGLEGEEGVRAIYLRSLMGAGGELTL